MSGGRSLYKAVWTNFVNSLKRTRFFGECVGVDYNGTEYYELPVQNASRRRPERWFQPKIKDDFEQEIPPEWEAWLRHRRSEPPTREEVEQNYNKMMMIRKKAKELESKISGKKSIPQLGVTASSNRDFPVREDLEEMPGSKIQKRRQFDE